MGVNLQQRMQILIAAMILTQAVAEFSDFSFLSKDNLCSNPNSEFMCRNKQCIQKSQRCDGVNQCQDASDEIGCDVYLCLAPHWFRCNTSEMCISSSFRCDGEIDCGDRSDEANCDNFTAPVFKHQCRPDEFQCNDNFCIPMYQVCDETFDCLDHSDEVDGCTINHPCDGFQCRNHRCIPHEWRCNGMDDCMDNSDEEQCENFIQPKDCTIETGHFLCKNRLNCIKLHDLCDKTENCPDKSDETANCTEPHHSCKVKGCSHECIQGPDGAICLCPKGYKQSVDGVCHDINECEEIFGICDQKCHNLDGSYECVCDEKYELQRDKKTCKAHGGEGQLIFSTKHEIRGLFLDSGLYYEIANKLKYVVGVTSDGEHIFWTDVHSDNEAIIKADMDGGQRELLITSGLRSPEDLAIDWITGNIYFTDSEMQHIGVCSYDGMHCTIVLNKYISKPRGITLNPHKSEMFWTDWGHQPEIARAGMDGENDVSFVSTNIRWPNGLTVDYPNNRLYWIDAKLNTIESIGLDGTDRRIVLSEIVRHPFSIVVFEDRLYWSDWFDHSIQSCEKFTGKNRKTLIKLTSADVFGIHMLHSALQPKFDNPCAMAKCSHLCMLSQSTGYKCACPEEQELNADMHTCRAVAKKVVMAVGAGNLLLKLHHQILGKLNIEVITQNLTSINALTYDSLAGRIIVSDNDTKNIYAVSEDGKQIKTLIDDDIGYVQGMDFDYLSNNLYWCDSERRTLEVYSIATKTRKSLLTNLKGDIPLSLALVPDKGVMYVAFGTPDDNIYIDRMDMDGSTDRIHVISSGLVGKKINLVFDDKLRRVFWSCMETNNIESTSVDGDDRHGFRALLPAPNSIAILGNDLFWTNERSHRLFWADKLNINQKNKKITLDLPKNFELYLIPLTGVRVGENHPCTTNNGKCSDICLVSKNDHSICACGQGKVLSENNQTCIFQKHCNTDQYQCPSTSVCIPKSAICDKKKDCLYAEDEANCEDEYKCNFGQKQCLNGQCIAAHFWCNSHYDCFDRSDEADCVVDENPKCSVDQFQCDSKDCINYSAMCDHYDDCPDGSDERHCEFRTCNIREFRCATGKCIPHSWRCDGQTDCPDLSDEDDCDEIGCSSTMFMCTNKRCIDPNLVCNQENDCFDNSDEMNCAGSDSAMNTNIDYLICDDDEVTCSGNLTICIPEVARCNGTKECPGGEDETNCDFECPENQFQCTNKKCIEESWTCDKVDDCGDKSDEDVNLCANNPYRLSQTNSSLTYNVTAYKMIPCTDGFRCKSGNCLDWKLVCNHKIDCDDGSDEDGACESSCENSPCEQVCIRTPSGSKCDCHKGFKLESNAKTCEEVKHCDLYPPVCAQLCQEVDHDYRCSCFPRYQLRLDHVGCKSLGDPPSIIFSSDSEIRKIVPHKNELHLLQHEQTPTITGMDYSIKDQAIYYSISGMGAIYKLNLRNNTRHYIKYLQNPTKLSLDWVTDTIYFVEEFSAVSSTIKACHLMEQKCAKILNVDTTVSAFTVDPVNKYIFYATTYWWIFDKPKSILYKANLDGSSIHEMIHEHLEYVTGITYDVDRKLVYLTDLNRNVVERVSYSGKRREVVFYGGNDSNSTGTSVSFQHPYGLNLFEDHLYFMMPNSILKKCRLYGKVKCLDIKLHNSRVENFVVDQQSRQVDLPNTCDMHKCHYLCIQSEVGVKCVCPDGDVVPENGKCSALSNSLKNWEIIQNEANSFVKITKIDHPDEETTRISMVAIIMLILIITGALCSLFFFYRRKFAGSFSPGAAFVQFQYTNPIYNLETLTTAARDPNSNLSKRNSTSSTLPLRSQESQDSGLAINETMQDCQEFFNPMNDDIHGIPEKIV